MALRYYENEKLPVCGKTSFFRTVQHTFERVELIEMRLFSQITSEFVN